MFDNDEEMDYESLFQNDPFLKPKDPHAPSMFLFASGYKLDGKMHEFIVRRLTGKNTFRVTNWVNEPAQHDMDIVKDPELGWVLEYSSLSSEDVTAVGNLIDQHLYN